MSDLENALAGFRAESLVGMEWEPRGESDREKRKSLDAKAYTNWIRDNVNMIAALNPEECRTAFLERHGGPHQYGGGEATLPPGDRGDAWEGT